MVTMQSWMFLSSYEEMRRKLLAEKNIVCMSHMGNGVMGIAFGTTATVQMNCNLGKYEASFSYCDNQDIDGNGRPFVFPAKNNRNLTLDIDQLSKIPGSPIAYWTSQRVREVFSKSRLIDDVADVRQGLRTGDNGRFLRYWHEVSFLKIGFDFESIPLAHSSGQIWFPYNKGGSYRK